MMSNDLSVTINAVLAKAPEWIRNDLVSKEPGTRRRAEEALAAMITAALRPDGVEGV